LAAVSPLAWAHHPLLAMFAPGAWHGLVAEPDRARWSAWLTELAEELADPHRLGARELVAGLLKRSLRPSRYLIMSVSSALPLPVSVHFAWHHDDPRFLGHDGHSIDAVVSGAVSHSSGGVLSVEPCQLHDDECSKGAAEPHMIDELATM